MTTNKLWLTLHYFALLVAGVIHFSGPKPTYTPKLKNDPSGPSGPTRVAEHKWSPRPSSKLGSGNQTVPFSVEATTLRKSVEEGPVVKTQPRSSLHLCRRPRAHSHSTVRDQSEIRGIRRQITGSYKTKYNRKMTVSQETKKERNKRQETEHQMKQGFLICT